MSVTCVDKSDITCKLMNVKSLTLTLAAGGKFKSRLSALNTIMLTSKLNYCHLTCVNTVVLRLGVTFLRAFLHCVSLLLKGKNTFTVACDEMHRWSLRHEITVWKCLSISLFHYTHWANAFRINNVFTDFTLTLKRKHLTEIYLYLVTFCLDSPMSKMYKVI